MKNTVLAQLSSVQNTVTSMAQVCLSSKNVAQINRELKSAKEKTAAALAAVMEHPNRKNLSQTRKSLTVIDNCIDGLMQGLASRELSVKDFRAVCSNLQTNFVQKFGTSLSEEVDKFKAEAGEVDDDQELTDDQQRIRAAIIANTELIAAANEAEVSEDEEESEYDVSTREKERAEQDRMNILNEAGANTERRLERLRGMRKLLPERMTAPYSVLRLPVVPNFETEAAKNPVLLDKLAIPFTEIPLYGATGTGVPLGLNKVKMERYVIFEQQVVLLVSKSYINNLLEHKLGQREAENKGEFGAHRKVRKELAYRIEVARGSVEKAAAEYKATPSQKAEIERLTEKHERFTREVNTKLRSQYTKEDRELMSKIREVQNAIKSIDNKIDGNSAGSKLSEYLIEVAKLEKELAQLLKKANALNKKLSKTADLKKMIEQIEIMERKIDKARAAESARERLIPDAEANLKRLMDESERNEDTLKDKRKVAKRAGDPITPEDYARSVLSVINERSGSKYALVTPKAAPNPRNSRDILCFWLMPTSKLTALMKATSGKAKVMQWDFPFESERHIHAESERKDWAHPSDRGAHLFERLHGRKFKDLSQAEQKTFFNSLSPSEQREFLDFLEYSKNAHHRPEGWKSMYKQARRVVE